MAGDGDAGRGADGGGGRAPDEADGAGSSGRPAAGERSRPHAVDASLRTGALPDSVRCPHCGETDSEQFSAFGSAVSVSQFYCRGCRTVFEYFKWR